MSDKLLFLLSGQFSEEEKISMVLSNKTSLKDCLEDAVIIIIANIILEYLND